MGSSISDCVFLPCKACPGHQKLRGPPLQSMPGASKAAGSPPAKHARGIKSCGVSPCKACPGHQKLRGPSPFGHARVVNAPGVTAVSHRIMRATPPLSPLMMSHKYICTIDRPRGATRRHAPGGLGPHFGPRPGGPVLREPFTRTAPTPWRERGWNPGWSPRGGGRVSDRVRKCDPSWGWKARRIAALDTKYGFVLACALVLI